MIVNLTGRLIEVYRAPKNGSYSDIRRVAPGDVVDIEACPGWASPLRT